MRAILTYHSVDPSGSVISIHPDAFRSHVRWLASGSVRVVSVSRILELHSDEDAVAITFDDGFRNFASIAWPMLRQHELPVTLFVVTDYVGDTNAWNPRSASTTPKLPLLDWDALNRLADEGVELGSHTRTHPRLDGLSRSRLLDEIEGSADRLEARTGVRPKTFAYPYGVFGDPACDLVAESYELGLTTELRTLTSSESRDRLPRLDMYYFRQPGQLEEWGTGRWTRRLWVRRMGRGFRGSFAFG